MALVLVLPAPTASHHDQWSLLRAQAATHPARRLEGAISALQLPSLLAVNERFQSFPGFQYRSANPWKLAFDLPPYVVSGLPQCVKSGPHEIQREVLKGTHILLLAEEGHYPGVLGVPPDSQDRNPKRKTRHDGMVSRGYCHVACSQNGLQLRSIAFL